MSFNLNDVNEGWKIIIDGNNPNYFDFDSIIIKVKKEITNLIPCLSEEINNILTDKYIAFIILGKSFTHLIKIIWDIKEIFEEFNKLNIIDEEFKMILICIKIK